MDGADGGARSERGSTRPAQLGETLNECLNPARFTKIQRERDALPRIKLQPISSILTAAALLLSVPFGLPIPLVLAPLWRARRDAAASRLVDGVRHCAQKNSGRVERIKKSRACVHAAV